MLIVVVILSPSSNNSFDVRVTVYVQFLLDESDAFSSSQKLDFNSSLTA